MQNVCLLLNNWTECTPAATPTRSTRHFMTKESLLFPGTYPSQTYRWAWGLNPPKLKINPKQSLVHFTFFMSYIKWDQEKPLLALTFRFKFYTLFGFCVTGPLFSSYILWVKLVVEIKFWEFGLYYYVSAFYRLMPFLSPDQQRQSAEALIRWASRMKLWHIALGRQESPHLLLWGLVVNQATVSSTQSLLSSTIWVVCAAAQRKKAAQTV